MPPAYRYQTLDLLRGIAAFAVVLFHLTIVRLLPEISRYGFLAVDFFFVLSGFVMSFAYQERLDRGLGFEAFIRRRLVRLYPLCLLGVVIGFAVILIKWRIFPHKVDPPFQVGASGLLSALMLPDFLSGEVAHHELFPCNGPMWSLFLELAVNALWAGFARRLRTSRLIAVICLAAVGIVCGDLLYGTGNLGMNVQSFWVGVCRVLFGFPLGVLIYRFRDRLKVPSKAWGPPALSLALIGVAAMPVKTVVWDALGALVLLPLIVTLAASQTAGGRLSQLIGDLSYPVYVLHFPILLVASGLHQTLLSHLNVGLLDAGTIVFLLVVSYGALKLYDEPLRRVLSMRSAPVKEFWTIGIPGRL